MLIYIVSWGLKHSNSIFFLFWLCRKVKVKVHYVYKNLTPHRQSYPPIISCDKSLYSNWLKSQIKILYLGNVCLVEGIQLGFFFHFIHEIVIIALLISALFEMCSMISKDCQII